MWKSLLKFDEWGIMQSKTTNTWGAVGSGILSAIFCVNCNSDVFLPGDDKYLYPLTLSNNDFPRFSHSL